MNPHSVIYDYLYLPLLISFVVSKGLDVTLEVKNIFKMVKTVLVALILIGFACADPQLDIPEAPKGLRVVVSPNSYANDDHDHEEKESQPKSEANTQFDSDRSQRYGSEKIKLLIKRGVPIFSCYLRKLPIFSKK